MEEGSNREASRELPERLEVEITYRIPEPVMTDAVEGARSDPLSADALFYLRT